jgi:site-specific recombinase XerD
MEMEEKMTRERIPDSACGSWATGEFGGKFIDHLRMRGYAESTIEIRRNALLRFARYLERHEPDVRHPRMATEEALGRYRLHLMRGNDLPATRESHLYGLKAFFRFLEEERIVFASPVRDMVCRTERPRRGHVPSEEEVRKLLDSCEEETAYGVRNRAIFETAYGSGLRLGEILRLDLASVNFEGGTLKVAGKGGKERLVPVGEAAGFRIRRYLEHARDVLLGGNARENALWISGKGGRLGKSALAAALAHARRRAGVNRISFHALRRACASHMLRNGAHPAQLQQMLGHSCVKTLNHYLETGIEDLKKTHAATRPGE